MLRLVCEEVTGRGGFINFNETLKNVETLIIKLQEKGNVQHAQTGVARSNWCKVNN